MTMNEFTKGVSNELNNRGVDAEVKSVVKNNGLELTAVVVKSESGVCPTVYINKNFDRGDSVMETVDEIIATVESSEAGFTAEDITSIIKDFESVIPRLRVKLVNGANEEALANEGVPCRKTFGDLIAFPVIEVGDILGADDAIGTIKVNGEMLKMWDTDEDAVINEAIDNSNKETRVETLFGALGMSDDDEMAEMLKDCPFVVASNAQKINGAVAMLNGELIRQFSNDCIVIPSSIHEVLLLKADGTDEEDINSMIRDVNSQCVLPEEVLSDHAYRFQNGEWVA